LVFLLIVVGAAIAYLIQRWRDLGFQWGEFARTLQHVDGWWVLTAACFSLLTYVGRALRWQVLMRPVKCDAGFKNLFSATVIGFTALVLFGRAGELVRPYLIAVKEKVPFSSQIAAWLLERIFDVLTALLIFGFALSRVHTSGANVGPNLRWVLRVGGSAAGILGVLALALLVALSWFSSAMRTRLLESLRFLPEPSRRRVEEIVVAFTEGVGCARSRSILYPLAFYSLLEWALIIGAYECLFRALPATAPLGFTDVVIFVGFAAFGAVVQIPGVGGGVQVVAVVVLTELFGMSLEVSGGMALLIWFTTFVVVVPVGVLLAFREGINWQKLRSIEKEASL